MAQVSTSWQLFASRNNNTTTLMGITNDLDLTNNYTAVVVEFLNTSFSKEWSLNRDSLLS